MNVPPAKAKTQIFPPRELWVVKVPHKKKKEKLSGWEYGKISVKSLRKRLLI